LLCFYLSSKFLQPLGEKPKKQVKQFKAVLKRKKDIEESDTELSNDLESRKAKISKEIKAGEEITSLSKPNDWS